MHMCTGHIHVLLYSVGLYLITGGVQLQFSVSGDNTEAFPGSSTPFMIGRDPSLSKVGGVFLQHYALLRFGSIFPRLGSLEGIESKGMVVFRLEHMHALSLWEREWQISHKVKMNTCPFHGLNYVM